MVGHAGATEPHHLAAALSKISGSWTGGVVEKGAFRALNGTGSWIAMLGRGKIGHWVVVDGVNAAGVQIRDPAKGVVTMATDAFIKEWNGSVVFTR
jgi:hypothetical protein